MKISFRYILIELLTAILTTALFIVFGLIPKFFAYTILTYGLIVATFIDFAIQEIPDSISLGGIVVGLLLAVIFPSIMDMASRFGALAQSFVGMLIGGGIIYAVGFFGEMIFKKEAMGGGDVKLMAAIGAFLGWKFVLLTFFIACFFGAIAGIILKLRYGREIIPFGPYLSLAAVAVMFFGNNILRLLTTFVF
jgi:leader peptidase (prepilin peptidase)/N-methyltransferase